MNPNESSLTPAWQDHDDAPDLSQPEWAEKLDKTPVRLGPSAQSRTQGLDGGQPPEAITSDEP